MLRLCKIDATAPVLRSPSINAAELAFLNSSATVAAVRGCYNKCTTTRDIMMPITAPIIAATIVVPLLLLRLLLLYKTPR